MSKFTIDELARGIKLTVSHMFDLPSHIATTLNNAANLIQQDQLHQGYAPFRLNFNIPVIDGHLVVRNAVTISGPVEYDYCIPFTLPPLQEFFSNSGATSDTTPLLILDEVQLSFDQRGEAAAIADSLYASGGTGHAGKVDFDNVDATGLQLSIVEKKMELFGGPADNIPQREVFSANLPATAFSGRDFRLNPWIVEGLSRAINPYHSYLIMLRVNDLDQPPTATITRNSHALVSLNINLRFRHPLVGSDVESGGADVQNIPSDHDGEPDVSASTLSLSVPSPDTDIEADSADGLQTNYVAIDNLYRKRFRGGFTKDSDRPGYTHMADDCGYSVIAVPMFGNLTNNRSIRAVTAQINDFPYTQAGSADPGADRRIVMLDYPFTVHHVLAAWNYMSPTDGTMPTAFDSEIGVCLMTGLRSDEFSYEQVAYASINQTNKASFRVDAIKSKLNSGMNADVSEWEMLSIPLVLQGGNAGSGYPVPATSVVPHGRPFWCGNATSRLTSRRNVGAIGGGDATPATLGCEQAFEIRWNISNGAGLESAPNTDTYVGYGGHWVYLFGKVGLINDGDIPV